MGVLRRQQRWRRLRHAVGGVPVLAAPQRTAQQPASCQACFDAAAAAPRQCVACVRAGAATAAALWLRAARLVRLCDGPLFAWARCFWCVLQQQCRRSSPSPV